MSSEAPSSAVVKDERRRRRKMSKTSRKSSDLPTQSSLPAKNSPANDEGESQKRLSSERLQVLSTPKSGTREVTTSPMALNRSLVNLLEEIKEDVVTPEQAKDISRLDLLSNKSSEDDQVHKMYVQTTRGFKAVDEQPERFSGASLSRPDEDATNKCMASSIQRVWMAVSTICHGLLGGASITHLILIWVSNPQDYSVEFLRVYASFAEVYGNTFYFLATICMVSVLDRMDLTCFKFSQPRSALWVAILLIYAATILLSLSCDSIDSRLYLGGFNVTIDEDEIRIRKLFNVWNNLSVGRSAGGILGWIFLGTVTRDNLWNMPRG